MRATMDRRQAQGDRRWARLNPHLGSDLPQHRDCLKPAASLIFDGSETREAVRKVNKSGTLGKLLITAYMIRETINLVIGATVGAVRCANFPTESRKATRL